MYTVFIVRFFLQRKYVGSFVSEFFFLFIIGNMGSSHQKMKGKKLLWYGCDQDKYIFDAYGNLFTRIHIFCLCSSIPFFGYSVLFFHSRVECTIQKRHYDAHLRFSIPHFHDDIHIRTAHISLHPSGLRLSRARVTLCARIWSEHTIFNSGVSY